MQTEGHAPRREGRKALPRGTGKGQVNGVFRQPIRPMRPGNLTPGNRAGNAIGIGNRQRGFHAIARLNGRLADVQERRVIQHHIKTMILLDLVEAPHILIRLRRVQELGEIQAFRFPVLNRTVRDQTIRPTNHLINRTEAELRHQLTNFLSNKVHEVHHVISSPHKLFTELRILRRNTHRAGVFVTHAHHNTTHHHQRCSRKTIFLSPEQGGNHHITPGLKLTIGLDNHTATQVVHHQRLMRVRQTQLPRKSRMLDTSLRRRAGAPIVTGNQNHIRMTFRHTGGNRSDTHLGHELHVNTCIRVRVLQIKDKLSQILNGINVMMRRR